MTDQTERDQTMPDLSSTRDPLGSDPLADDYGTVVPPPAASSIPPAPPASAAQTAASPDPTTDRFSAFDEPTAGPVVAGTPASGSSHSRGRGTSKRRRQRSRTSRPTSTAAATPEAPPAPRGPRGQGGSAPSPVVDPARRRSRTGRVVLFVVGALVLLPVVSGILLSRVVGDSDTDRSPDPADRSLTVAEVSVSPSSVTELPSTVTSLRVEFQGPGRTADVRLYTPEGSSNVENQSLPYAVEVPVSTDDAYLSVSADDYGYRGSQPMRCTISVGDTVLVTAVGTKSVDCKVTDETWRRDR